MPEYRRIDCPGATIFFTVVTYGRRPIFTDDRIVAVLRDASPAKWRITRSNSTPP